MTERGPAVTERGPAPRPGERGYLLPAALLALLTVSVLSAAALLVARSERTMSAAHRATVEAREAARAGLAQYLATNRSPPPRRAYAFGADSAAVRALPLVRFGAGRRLYLLTSRGVSGRRRGAPAVARRVRAVAVHDRGLLFPAGALSVGGRLRVSDDGSGAVAVDGFDACDSAAVGALAGVAVPEGGFGGDPAGVRGDPSVDESRSARALLEASGLDSARWEGVREGRLVRPDRVLPGEAWPEEFSGWPVVLVRGSAELAGPGSGRGTLVVAGDLTLGGSFAWEGLVLVGGRLAARDAASVSGAVLAGLDRLRGASPDSSALGGSAAVRYDSCHLREAARRALERVALKPGTRYEPAGRPSLGDPRR